MVVASAATQLEEVEDVEESDVDDGRDDGVFVAVNPRTGDNFVVVKAKSLSRRGSKNSEGQSLSRRGSKSLSRRGSKNMLEIEDDVMDTDLGTSPNSTEWWE